MKTLRDITWDFTSQLSGKLESPVATGSFSEVYRCTVDSSIIGKTEVAVKVFKVDPRRNVAKLEKAMVRELTVWLKLKDPTIVPLLGAAQVKSPLHALVCQWMPSGTLAEYLEEQATNITPSARIKLVEGIAKGLYYVHSENVIHGDLHPGNVLIDKLGNPRLADFGLATIVENPELQWNTTTAARDFNPRWRAPEDIGIDGNPERSTSKSDIYSFGGVTFYVISGNVPWKDMRSNQICIKLSQKVTPSRPHDILHDYWNLIQKCWSWNPEDRPEATRVLNWVQVMTEYPRDATSDFTSQVSDELRSPIATGSFGEVYRCTVESSMGATEVAVKVFKIDPRRTMKKLIKAMFQGFKVWFRLKHPNIVPLLGTAIVGSPLPALVSQWMSSGALSEYFKYKTKTVTPSIRDGLVKGIAEGLHYLHSEYVIHGDLHPGNVLIDGSGNPCLTDFGLANVADEMTVECSFDSRWRAPEIVGINGYPERPTFESDIYSFGSVLFLIVSGDIPWKEKEHSHEIDSELSRRATPRRPRNILDHHWKLIQGCWSWEPGPRPEVTEVLNRVQVMAEYRGETSTSYDLFRTLDMTDDSIKLVEFPSTSTSSSSLSSSPSSSALVPVDPKDISMKSPCFVHSHLDKGASLLDWLHAKENEALGADVGVAKSLKQHHRPQQSSALMPVDPKDISMKPPCFVHSLLDKGAIPPPASSDSSEDSLFHMDAAQRGARDDIHSREHYSSARSRIPKDREPDDDRTPTMADIHRVKSREYEHHDPRAFAVWGNDETDSNASTGTGDIHRANSREYDRHHPRAFAVWGHDETDSNASDSDF